MPRTPIVRSNSHFYHITARSNNREFFYLPINEVWQIMTLKLRVLQKEHDLKIGAFVLMSNHFHLLMSTPKEDIDRIMYFFMKEVTLSIQRRSGRINKIFGGRYKGSLINTNQYLVNVYKYILRNPLEVGLVKEAQDYRYSTLYYAQEGSAYHPFLLETVLSPTQFDSFHDLDELKWLNNGFSINESESIKCGLQRPVFEYKKDRVTNKAITPEIRHPPKKPLEELWDDLVDEEELAI